MNNNSAQTITTEMATIHCTCYKEGKKERKRRKTKAPTLHDIDPLLYTLRM